MTRWYPVPVPLGNKVIFKVYNSEGHFVADACDEATATHIADLHNAELRVTEIADEDYREEPRQDEPVAAVNISDPLLQKGVYKIAYYDHEHFTFPTKYGANVWHRAWVDPCWQLLYPGKVYAQAPLEGCPGYLTPGKCYEVVQDDGMYFRALDDGGVGCRFAWTNSPQVKGRDWTRIVPEDL